MLRVNSYQKAEQDKVNESHVCFGECPGSNHASWATEVDIGIKQSLRQGSSFRFTEELALKTKESKICRKAML